MKEALNALIFTIAFPLAIFFVIWDRAMGLAEEIIFMLEGDRRV